MEISLQQARDVLGKIGLTVEDLFCPDVRIALHQVVFKRNAFWKMSNKESDVARMICAGWSDKEISQKTRKSVQEIACIREKFDGFLEEEIDRLLDSEITDEEARELGVFD